MKALLVGVAAVAVSATGALAQDNCSGYVGQTVQAKTFDVAIASLPKVAPKGEYETTADYEARRAKASASGLLIIAKKPEMQSQFPNAFGDNEPFIRYNADAGVLEFQEFAFGNTSVDVWGAIYKAGLSEKVPVDTRNNLDAVIESAEVQTGSYTGTNAFGVSARVREINRVSKVIFEPTERYGQTPPLFPAAKNKPWVAGTIPMTPAEAQRLKPVLKLAFVVEPKEPYLVKATHRPSHGGPTIDSPTNLYEVNTILVAISSAGSFSIPPARCSAPSRLADLSLDDRWLRLGVLEALFVFHPGLGQRLEPPVLRRACWILHEEDFDRFGVMAEPPEFYFVFHFEQFGL